MDTGAKTAFAGAAATILIWWYFSGRKKYGFKGMR